MFGTILLYIMELFSLFISLPTASFVAKKIHTLYIFTRIEFNNYAKRLRSRYGEMMQHHVAVGFGCHRIIRQSNCVSFDNAIRCRRSHICSTAPQCTIPSEIDFYTGFLFIYFYFLLEFFFTFIGRRHI